MHIWMDINECEWTYTYIYMCNAVPFFPQLRIYPLIFIPALLLHILKPKKKRNVSLYSVKLEASVQTHSKNRHWDWSRTNEPLTRIRSIHLLPSYLSTYWKLDPHICSIEYSYESIQDSMRFVFLFYFLFLLWSWHTLRL